MKSSDNISQNHIKNAQKSTRRCAIKTCKTCQTCKAKTVLTVVTCVNIDRHDCIECDDDDDFSPLQQKASLLMFEFILTPGRVLSLNVLPVLTILTALTVLTVFIVLAEYFAKHDSLLTTDNLKASFSFMQNSGRG